MHNDALRWTGPAVKDWSSREQAWSLVHGGSGPFSFYEVLLQNLKDARSWNALDLALPRLWLGREGDGAHPHMSNILTK
jgi:hypothetical protein